ncbi:MAG: hypothetical protein P1U61_08125 [Legionellaceae bacterium]|nr:hypothetical protein [Legionellaceae bacterium]
MKLITRLTPLTLCLFATSVFSDTTGQFFDVEIDGASISVAPKRNHSYPDVDVIMKTDGFTLSDGNDNNRRGFSISRRRPKILSILGPSGRPVTVSAYLNAKAKLNGQDYTFTISNYKFAVGNTNPLLSNSQAQIYRSTDGGQNWDTTTTFSNPSGSGDNALKSVSCDNSGQSCGAAGFNETSTNQGLIYSTQNAGDSWDGPYQPSSATLLGIQLWGMGHARQAKNCIAVGNSDTVAVAYLSSDCKDWSSAPVTVYSDSYSTQPTLNSVVCDNTGKTCIAAGFFFAGGNFPDGKSPGLIAKTTDTGASWDTQIIDVPDVSVSGTSAQILTLYGVSCSASMQQCVAAGFLSYFGSNVARIPVTYTSSDTGSTWILSDPLPTPPDRSYITQLQSVSCDATGMRCTTVGSTSDNSSEKPQDSIIYTTTDGGIDWSDALIPTAPEGSTDNRLLGVFCTRTGAFCVSVGNGSVNPLSYLSLINGSIPTASSLEGNASIFGVGGSS